MRGNKKTGSSPEVRLRSALHRRGYRFRNNAFVRIDGMATRPDVVFPSRQVAVFVDGCFWHRCPEHGNMPRRNADYWRRKLERNERRDRAVTDALELAGWQVVRLWEHVPVDDAVRAVEAALTGAHRL